MLFAVCHLNHNRAATNWREFPGPITGRSKAKLIQSRTTCYNDLKIALHNIIQLTYQLWSNGVPSFFTLLLSLSRVIAEPQTGIIWREKPLLSRETPWWLNRIVYEIILSLFETSFWFWSAINILLSNVFLICSGVSQYLTIKDFYFLKIQSWSSVENTKYDLFEHSKWLTFLLFFFSVIQ